MNRKIKIAYCIDDLYAASGMQRVLTLKANYLADKLGYDVTIFLTEEKDRPLYYPLSPLIKVINLDINFYRMYDETPFWPRLLKYKQYMRRYKRKFTQALMELRPDITVSLLRKEINFLCSIPDGSRKVGEIHFDKSNYRIFNGPVPAFVKKQISRLWMQQLITQLRKLDKFVVLTHEDCAQWTELDNVICIHNPASFNETQQYATCEHKQVVALGRYTYQKGFDLLLPAWKIVAEKHPEWTLQVFGGGDRTAFQQQAENLNILNTCHLNDSTDDVIGTLTNSSIFVLSSRYEGMPMVLGESMACGVPPVSFTCPCGPRDIITDGVDGLLVDNGNIDQLTEKLCYLIEHEEIRKQMGVQARESVKRFYIENIMPQWDQLFKSLLP